MIAGSVGQHGGGGVDRQLNGFEDKTVRVTLKDAITKSKEIIEENI